MDRKHLHQRGQILLNNSHFSDCEFYFPKDNKRINANKSLLALASPIMEKMFFSDGTYKEAVTSVVEIIDIQADAFEKFLLWIYSNEAKFGSVQVAISVFEAANKYEVIDLEQICEQYVLDHTDRETACANYKFGQIYNKEAIVDRAVNFIQKNTMNVLDSEDFSNCDMDTLMVILNQDKLWINNEVCLFKALDKYGRENHLDRNALEAAVRSIRFLIVDVDEFKKVESTLLTDQEKQCIIEHIGKHETTTLQYPDGFSKSTSSRCDEYIHISELDREILDLVREVHFEGDEITCYDYDERPMDGTPADIIFHNLSWYTDWRIVKELRNNLPRKDGENNNKYLTRIFEDDNPKIITALIECFKNLCLDDFIRMV